MLSPFLLVSTVSAAGPAPALTSVTTAGGAVGDLGGAYVATLTGTNLTGITSVTFGGVAGTAVTGVSATSATCIVPARGAGAVVSVIATTPGGSNGANSLFEYYSPAQEAMSGWWRASLASPTVPTASAGASGANGNLTAVAGAGTPSFVNALNSLAVATFDGAANIMSNASVVDATLLGSAAFHVYALFNTAVAGAASAGSAYSETAFLVDEANGHFEFTFSTRGVTLAHYDLNGTGLWREATVACTTAAWHLAHGWYDGVNLFVQLDSGSLVAGQTVVAPLSTTGSALTVGRAYTAAPYYNGKIAELGMSKLNLGATSRTKIKAYVNTRYNLAL